MKLLIADSAKVRLLADSAIARSGAPWFMPDKGENWRWRCAVAFRIGRLGKGISPRYAYRYFDAVTLLWVAEADGITSLDYMDGSAVAGAWQELTSPDMALSGPDWSGTAGELSPDVLLASLTELATVKTGDILAIIPPGAPSHPIASGSGVSLNLNGSEVIRFNIK